MKRAPTRYPYPPPRRPAAPPKALLYGLAVTAGLAGAVMLGALYWFSSRPPPVPSGPSPESPPGHARAIAEAPSSSRIDLSNLDTNNWSALFQTGSSLLQGGRLPEAIAVLRLALHLQPDEADTHFNIAHAYARLGDTNSAITHYSEATRIDPEYVEAHNNLGNLYVGQRNYQEATKHFSIALRVMPDHTFALNNMGKCLAAQGRTEEAISYFDEAARKDPHYLEPRFNLGMAFLRLGKPEEAVRQLEQVLLLEPSFELAKARLEFAQQEVARRRAQTAP